MPAVSVNCRTRRIMAMWAPARLVTRWMPAIRRCRTWRIWGWGKLPARIIRRMKTPSVRSACAVKPARARIRRRATGRFPTFPNGFPADFIAAFEQRIGHKVIGNKPASGTAILDELGEEHLAKRTPIVYTSADSVFQIACNEAIFSREELYEMCRIAREMLTGDLCVGRVIARPFVGKKAGAFQRTSGRRDFSVEPFSRTLLDAVKDAGMASYGVGKIEDIFALRGLTGSNHAAGNPACIEAWLDYMRKPFDGLCFTNLVDTDMLYGHRRDPQGFADALAYFDSKLPEIIDLLGDEDLLVITADHGCDPTFKGTDHTREHIPLLVYHKGMKGLTDLGVRKTYADIGATCAEWLGLPDRFSATSFADKLK